MVAIRIRERFQPTNGPLNIRLENFRTECGWDFVYIYDGDGVHGDLLAAFWLVGAFSFLNGYF